MSRAQLFIRNALACEHAMHPKCECACGGAYHGKQHPASFFVNGLAKIKNESMAADPNSDLFGVCNVEDLQGLLATRRTP